MWTRAQKRQEYHKISSVLLGLEGSAPLTKSPFGGVHDSSGKSKDVSVTGGRKWRAYRANGALQIPADYGGMRVKITRDSFAELRDVSRIIDLRDPTLDIDLEGSRTQPR